MDQSPVAMPKQFLTFHLDRELFAIDIAMVREVLAFDSLTRVPRTPDCVRGVLNLRGNAVPVVDMRLKLGLGRTEQTIDTCVVIVESGASATRTVFGALVDSVQEVIDIPDDLMSPVPMGSRVSADVVRGLAKRSDQLIMILDLERIFESTFESILAAGELPSVTKPSTGQTETTTVWY